MHKKQYEHQKKQEFKIHTGSVSKIELITVNFQEKVRNTLEKNFFKMDHKEQNSGTLPDNFDFSFSSGVHIVTYT